MGHRVRIMKLCWFCDRGITASQPVTLPTEYHETTGQFDVMGQFCSWECVKSYIRDVRIHKAKEYSLLRMAYSMSGHSPDKPIVSRPPKSERMAYGGTMTDEAWFGSVTDFVLSLPPHMVRVEDESAQTPSRSSEPRGGFMLGPMVTPKPKPTARTKKHPSTGTDVLSMLSGST